MSLGAGSAGLLTHRVAHTHIYIDTSCMRLISEASSWCRGTPAFKEMFAFVFNLKSGFPILLMWEKLIKKYYFCAFQTANKCKFSLSAVPTKALVSTGEPLRGGAAALIMFCWIKKL